MIHSFTVMYPGIQSPLFEYADLDIEAPTKGDALSALEELINTTNILDSPCLFHEVLVMDTKGLPLQ